MAKTHPHIDMPADDDLRAAAHGRTTAVVETYLALHHLVLATVPGIKASLDTVDASIGYAERQLGYDGWGMAAVTPYAKVVTLTLLAGAELPDPDGLLEGAAKQMRHVRLGSLDELAERAHGIAALLRAAAVHRAG